MAITENKPHIHQALAAQYFAEPDAFEWRAYERDTWTQWMASMQPGFWPNTQYELRRKTKMVRLVTAPFPAPFMGILADEQTYYLATSEGVNEHANFTAKTTERHVASGRVYLTESDAIARVSAERGGKFEEVK